VFRFVELKVAMLVHCGE